MSNITPITNPLMQPIQWKGQLYYTSHYFHQMYRNNCEDGGKYEQLKNFNALVRSLETYSNYIERGDIIELTRSEAGLESQPAFKAEAGSNLEPVFKATYGKPIMLINATAQIALTHHLDDAISKQASVAVNEQSATKALPPTNTMPSVAKDTRSKLQLAKMFGLQGNKALIAVNDWVYRDSGVNVMDELGIKSLKCDEQEAELTGAKVGELAGIPGNGTGKAQNINLALWKLGYLHTDKHEGKNIWRISEKGLSSGYIQYDDMKKESGKRSSMQVIVYNEGIVAVLKDAEAAEFDFKELKAKRKLEEAA